MNDVDVEEEMHPEVAYEGDEGTEAVDEPIDNDEDDDEHDVDRDTDPDPDWDVDRALGRGSLTDASFPKSA